MLIHLTTAAGAALALVAAGPVSARVVPMETPTQWRAPVAEPVRVLRPFDPPPNPYAAGHRGVDLAARPSSPVVAAGAGSVSFAGRVAGRGVVVVAHAGGLRTSYEPVTAALRAGAAVPLGAELGRLEQSAHCAAGCLHWGLRRGADYLDPMTLLEPEARGRARLLPLDALSAGRPASCAARASPSSGSGRPGSPRPRRARRPRPG